MKVVGINELLARVIGRIDVDEFYFAVVRLCKSFSTSRFSPSMMTFCVLSQSTDSSGQGTRVPTEGSWMIRVHSAFPGQARPKRSGADSVNSPSAWRSASKSMRSSKNTSGIRSRRMPTRSSVGVWLASSKRSGRSLLTICRSTFSSDDGEPDREYSLDGLGHTETRLHVVNQGFLCAFNFASLGVVCSPRLVASTLHLAYLLLERQFVGKCRGLAHLALQVLQLVVVFLQISSQPRALVLCPAIQLVHLFVEPPPF